MRSDPTTLAPPAPTAVDDLEEEDQEAAVAGGTAKPSCAAAGKYHELIPMERKCH